MVKSEEVRCAARQLRGNRDFTYEVITVASPLQDKSKAFALEIIKVCNEIKRTKRESILTHQLIRSGTSVGANIVRPCMPTAKRILLPNYKLH